MLPFCAGPAGPELVFMDMDWIKARKEELKLIILAHNYQRPEVQDVADMLGDSLALARKAAETDANYILFCGVDFMAESAKILSPDKVVLHPDETSCCPMAAMIDPEGLNRMMEEHPGAPVVSYVNTRAEIKAMSEVCCTSSNAVDVVRSLPQDDIIFVPDENLGMYVARFVPEKRLHLWPGYCHVHVQISLRRLKELKAAHPDAKVLVHPECTPDVIDYADHVLSTEGMVRHVMGTDGNEFIIGTEEGLVYRMTNLVKGKTFYRVEEALCHNMKKITITDVINTMKELRPVVELPEDIMMKARMPLERMVEVRTRGKSA